GYVFQIKLYRNKITARVSGTRRYSVTIEFNQGSDIPDVYCTCPYDWGGACKHVVATLFAAMERQEKEEGSIVVEQTLPTSFARKVRGERERVEGRSSSFLSSEAQDEGVTNVQTGTKSGKWTKKIEKYLLPEQIQPAIQATQSHWNLIYVIRDKLDRIILQACRQRLKKDGTVGETSQIFNYDFTDEEHFDELDRLIIPHVTNYDGLSVDKYYNPFFQSSRALRATPAQMFSTILKHLEGKDVYYSHNEEEVWKKIQVKVHPLQLSFILKMTDTGDSLQAVFHSQEEEVILQLPVRILLRDPFWILAGTNVYSIRDTEHKTIEYLQRSSWRLEISLEERDQFRTTILTRLLERYPVKSDDITIHNLENGFAKRIYLEERQSKLHVVLRYAYHNHEVPSQSTSSPFIVAASDLQTFYRIKRDLQAEADARRELLDTYMAEITPNEFVARQQSLDWIMQKLPVLVENGFEIYGRENLKTLKVRSNPMLNVTVTSGIDWFDLNMEVSYEGVTAEFKDLHHSIQHGERFVKLADGTLGVIPEEWMKKFKRAFALTDAKGSKWKLSRGHFSLIDQLFHEREIRESDISFRKYREKFSSFQSITPFPLSNDFSGELRPYQKYGYDWLQFLKEFEFNGCLADDMGLGKTIQTLALLQHEHTNGARNPSLIVVPTSIVFNWLNEGKRFTPSLDILCHAGNKRLKSIEELKRHNVIITSYGVLRRDIELFKELPLHYLILDESQNIKNAASQNAKAVKLLSSRHRLALTGTPVENNLMELWSQFDFLNPGLLGSRKGFQEQFVRPIERNKDEEAVEMLKNTIYPFILRRTKDVVAKELPPKMESVQFCDMEKPQRTLYNHWRDYYRTAILDSIETVGLQQSKFKVLEGLMKLRQICCHPHLVDDTFHGSSGKFEVWKEMVEELLAENHKALIFSQFVKMLRLLSDHCDTLEVDYEYLDGATRDREERVKRFQENGDVRLFLISLKAGGTGLNLTAADYVIHYDPWWNPAVEMQAT
ncbi:MAG: hypothetical protein EPO24_15365, partial [Bacteroidetes bacterium]